MKTLKILILAGIVFSGSVLMAQSYTFTKENSKIKWEGKKIGGAHDGIVQLKSGNLKLKRNKIKEGKFVLDMQSISNTDIENKGYREKLEKHLKSADFFAVEEYPEAILEITEVAEFKNNTAHINANLTIKGIMHPIHFEAMKKDDKIKSVITIDRSKYKVKYGSKSFFKNIGDKLIYDDFTIEVVLSL